WCGPCIGEMRAARQLHADLHDRADGIVFLNVSIDADETSWRKSMEKHHVEGLNVLAPGEWKSVAIQAYGIHAIPHYLLIAPDGRLLSANAPRPGDARQAIEQHLLKK
ncbi:MAG TPA: thioredoxin-like domain-containing protein, partial [bacterium]|nr:thioredoxin-like domain-containing protein [bacterium]